MDNFILMSRYFKKLRHAALTRAFTSRLDKGVYANQARGLQGPQPEPLKRIARGVALALGLSLFMPPALAPGLDLTPKEYARVLLPLHQYKCLTALYGKESAWDATAYNKAGAYGIPQLKNKLMLTKTPIEQVNYGLKYIKHRYGTPCQAYAHFKKKGWH